MKKAASLLLFFSLCFASEAQGNAATQDDLLRNGRVQEGKTYYVNPEFVKLFEQDYYLSAYNNLPYQFKPIVDTKAPKGYKPFYISHFGRHGTRSGWTESALGRIPATLRKADSLGILTPQGDSLLRESVIYAEKYDSMPGRLLPLGFEEQKILADRMYSRFKPVFKGERKEVRSVSSMVPRCIMTMTSFTNELTAIDPGLKLTWDTGENYMTYLATDSGKEAKKRCREMRDSLYKVYTPDTETFLRTLFTDPELGRKVINTDVQKFMHWVYTQGRLNRAFGMPKSEMRFLPMDAIYKFWDYGQIALYLLQCNSVEFGDQRMPANVPLAKDIIAKADAAIAGDNAPAADLRFAHDYGLLSIMSFIGLEGVGERMTMQEAQKKWFGSWYTPFAGNLQLIFYRNRGGDVLVKFLMNENETLLIGMEPVDGPYYKWDDVKKMLEDKIEYYTPKKTAFVPSSGDDKEQ